MEDANVPLSEINAQWKGYNEVTGGIGLMIGKKGSKNANVVQMPVDNTFRMDSAAENRRQNSRKKTSIWHARQRKP